jgi:hypothetical protein
MKRRLLTILIFLLAGALLNVAVAWASAAWANLDHAIAVTGLSSPDPPRWLCTRYASPGVSRVYAWVHDERFVTIGDQRLRFREGLIPDWSSIGARPATVGREIIIEDARGWPTLAVWDRLFWRKAKERQIIYGGIRLPLDRSRAYLGTRVRGLPTRVLWPGFALNTAFYAAVLWLLICGPFVMRRFVRVRRGLCPACAYPIGASATCTECGKPLPHRARPTA